MLINGLDFEFGSDLKQYGHTDDGQPYIGEIFYISATNKRGDRWRHRFQFDGVKVEQDDYGYDHFIDQRPWAIDQCKRIIDRIHKAGVINPEYWDSDRPVYGSQAYEEYGQHDDLEWERSQNI